jgi:hypothetical protein
MLQRPEQKRRTPRLKIAAASGEATNNYMKLLNEVNGFLDVFVRLVDVHESVLL